jgi:membrane protease YdiL (CAAX protease family)
VRPAKHWQIESVAMLIVGVSMGIVLGGLATMLLRRLQPGLSGPDEKFYAFLFGGAFLHGFSLVLIHLFLRQHNVRWKELLGLDEPGSVRAAGLGLLTGTIVVPAALGLNELCRLTIELFQPEAVLQPSLQILQVAISLPRRICFGIAALVMAPLVEEILFRGVAYKTIRDWGFPRVALASSSILFGLIHANLMTLFPLTLFAVVLAVLYEKTGRLIAPMAAHAVFNAINFFYFLHSVRP